MFKGRLRWKEVLLGYLVFVWMFLFMVAGGFIFSGSASAQQSTPLTVLQPNGGESWNAGNRYVLKWQSPTNAYTFILQYSTDNKTTWRNIKTVLANNTCNNTGSYLDCKTGWQIPAQDGRKPQSFVRVIARNASNQTIGRDVSDRAFVIEVLRVTSPNGNETLRAGSNHTITWETYALTKQISRVILQYSTDGGSSWKPIKTFVGTNPGNFTWTVPNDPSTNCRVRVVLRDTNGTVIASDVSDRPFTIIGSGSNPSFAISLYPDSLMVPQGGSNTTTLIVTPQNGFTGTITLSLVAGQDRVPEGLTLSPQSVQVTGSSRVSQILTLNASANTPTGTYRLKVRGASGNLTREADLTITVTSSSPSLVMVLNHDMGRCLPSPTFNGTLEGTPTAPLRLQYALKPKGAQDFGPWQDAGEMQVSGNQATFTLSQPPYPVGMESAPWQIRIRVLMGDQPVGLRSAPNNPVVPFFQITSSCFRPVWLQRGFSWPVAVVEMAYGAGSLCFYTGENTLRCLDAETGEERWRFSRPNFRMLDVFVTEDGRVLVAGLDYSTSPFKALVLVLGNQGSLQATYDLSVQLDLITAILLDGNIIYVGGVRWVDNGGGSRCLFGRPGIYRLRVAKYILTGSGASLEALYDPTPGEIGELPPEQDGSVPCEDNYSSVAALRLEGGKLYVAFSVGGKVYKDFNDKLRIEPGFPGVLRLNAQGFSKDWVYTPWRPASGRISYWGGDGSYYFNPPQRGWFEGAIQYTADNFSLGNRYLYFHSMAGCTTGQCFSENGPVLVNKETGALVNTDNAILPKNL